MRLCNFLDLYVFSFVWKCGPSEYLGLYPLKIVFSQSQSQTSLFLFYLKNYAHKFQIIEGCIPLL
jgi:hypothetical protein